MGHIVLRSAIRQGTGSGKSREGERGNDGAWTISSAGGDREGVPYLSPVFYLDIGDAEGKGAGTRRKRQFEHREKHLELL